MQKYQGNSTNAPRETFIGDQRHMLAYINPFEEDLLRNYGGTGQKGPGGVPAFPPASIERAMDRNYNSNQAAGTQNTDRQRSPTANSTPAERVARVASTAQAERDNGVNDRDRDPNPGYFGGSGQSTSSVNRDNEANRIAAQNEAAKRAQEEQIVKNKERAKKIALGTALDIERKKALAGGHSYFKSSDGKFYTTDPNAPKELQDALAQRSVAYTPEANPTAFNADGTPRGGIFGFANIADMFDMGGPRASGNTYSGGPLAGYGNALGMKPLGMSDEDWEKTKAQQQLMKESKMGAFAQRPDFSKYPETGFPDPAQSTDGFGGDSYQGGGDNQGAAPAPTNYRPVPRRLRPERRGLCSRYIGYNSWVPKSYSSFTTRTNRSRQPWIYPSRWRCGSKIKSVPTANADYGSTSWVGWGASWRSWDFRSIAGR
jgi:hypothetical protein